MLGRHYLPAMKVSQECEQLKEDLLLDVQWTDLLSVSTWLANAAQRHSLSPQNSWIDLCCGKYDWTGYGMAEIAQRARVRMLLLHRSY